MEIVIYKDKDFSYEKLLFYRIFTMTSFCILLLLTLIIFRIKLFLF